MRGKIEADNRGRGMRMNEKLRGNNNPTVVFNKGRGGGSTVFVAAEKYFVESASPSEIRTRVNTFLITPAVCVSVCACCN